MNHERKILLNVVILVIALCMAGIACAAEEMGTAFTYQGRLSDANSPAEGLYDMEFKLYVEEPAVPPIQVGDTVNVDDVDVIDGYFTVEIDFGEGFPAFSVFDGKERLIEIGIRPGELEDPNVYSTLSPWQVITPTPYAMHSKNADTLDNLDSADFASSGHNHDSDYALISHIHDDRYYTETELASSGSSSVHWNNLTSVPAGLSDGDDDTQLTEGQVDTYVANNGYLDGSSALDWDNITIDMPAGFADGVDNTGDSDWSGAGTGSMYPMFLTDKVGIGTDSPSSLLHVKLSGTSITNGVRLETSQATNEDWYIYMPSTDNLVFRNDMSDYVTFQKDTGNVGIGDTAPDGALEVNPDGIEDNGDEFVVSFLGNVGIGVRNPSHKLYVSADNSTTDGTDGSFIDIGNTNDSSNVLSGIRFQNGSTTNTFKGAIFYEDVASFGRGDMIFANNETSTSGNVTVADARMTIAYDGNVGIGTTSPGTKLHIEGGSDASLGGGGFLVTGSLSSTNMVIDDNEIIARNNGAAAKLYLNNGSGNVVVGVLEITGGSDVSEQFEISAVGADVSLSAGMVVRIDPENPGALVVSDKAYDRRVAGIISGAGDVRPGMLMGQQGTKADGEHPVALTGRVYCQADASIGSIEPGDLLTTSEVPGHAMKVKDYTKAQGAILGKAMSSLKSGRGLVLVLVTLQ